MASATVFLSVGAPACLVKVGNDEVLEALAQIPDPNDPVTVRLRARPGTKQADLLQQKIAGDQLIVSGTLHLEESMPVITPGVICKGADEQYFNEITLVGNLAKPGRQAEKSCSRSLGESRPIRNGDSWEEQTDWFIVRGYGSNDSSNSSSLRDRLNNAVKGSLVQIAGTLSQRKSKEGDTYVEVKARRIRVHKRGGGGGAPNPAEGKAVVGYDAEDFTGQHDDMPDGW